MLKPAFIAGASFSALLTLTGCDEVDRKQSADRFSANCLAENTDKKIAIQGGTFVMGQDPQYREEGPPRRVDVASFSIDLHEVTNRQFSAFVADTGFVTDAEKPPPGADNLPAELASPGAAVFVEPDEQNRQWWRWIAGANWRHPTGPASTMEFKQSHPVVNISLADAQAYAKWAGGSLPTEEQWEYAAQAGRKAPAVPVDDAGVPTANYYQGVFPVRDTRIDGHTETAPSGCFPANAFGLYDMIGNVWEWTEPVAGDSSATAIIKGGSFLCAANYCARYRPAARQFQERDLGTNHVGFRVVYE